MNADEIISPFYEVPTEILFNIFFYLPAKDLIKCRQVCLRWKLIIDELTEKDELWNSYCQRDFNECYWPARKKANHNLSWYQLYKSLSLWPRLREAVEETDEFAPAHRYIEEIRSVEILSMGAIGVHKKNVIQYYDLNTLTLSTRSPITGHYARYTENDSVIVIQSYQLHLYVIQKFLNKTFPHDTVTFHHVKMCLLTDSQLFFVNLYEEIYVCDIYDDHNIKCTFVTRAEDQDGIISLGFNSNGLNILTCQRKIYSIKNSGEMKHMKTITNESNVLNVLFEFNFLELLDWRVYFQWMYVLNHSVPEGPMRDIIIIRPYGDIFFVGTNSGVLSIFHRPFINGEIDLFHSEPLHRFNFMERADIPILATCPILQIDVLENENGHTVFVAMPKKVAVLKYTHSSLKSASLVSTPYELKYLQ